MPTTEQKLVQITFTVNEVAALLAAFNVSMFLCIGKEESVKEAYTTFVQAQKVMGPDGVVQLTSKLLQSAWATLPDDVQEEEAR